ncbi:MAG: hypothetical protein Kow0068_21080 [Marinilabiliales bacterium]
MSMLLNASKITVHLNDPACYVVIDNQMFTTNYNSFDLDYISSGYHNIAIMKKRMIPRYMAGTYTIYEGNIYIPENSHVIAKLNSFNKLIITDIISYNNMNSYTNINYGSYNYDNCNYYMDNAVFNDLLFTLKNTSFDSNRLLIAKQAAMLNGISSTQVYEIMKCFSFESNRLEFAKYAYHYVSDPNNYYIVNNAFVFSSSIRELNDFIFNGLY